MLELQYPFDPEYILKKKKSIKAQLCSGTREGLLHKKIAVLGGSTTKNLVLMLELFLLNEGIEPEFYESEYDQYYQEAMFDNPKLSAFAPDIIYIHTSNRNIEAWPQTGMSREQVDGLLDAEYARFEGIWESLASGYACPIIQNNFDLPFYRVLGNRDAWDHCGRTNYVTRLNQRFYDYACAHEGFFIHDIMFEQSCYGLDRWSSPYHWHMYKYCCDVPAIPYMAFGLSHIIKSIFGKNKKVLCLDCDNTLWGGVIGDDGVDGIEIGQETSLGQTFAEFQQYVRTLRDTGVLLAVDSKNDEDVARSGFERPDSTLHTDDFVSFYANWEPKDRNLQQIAVDINLLPDSFVFADDNPAERHIVRENVPGAAVPELDTVENYIRIIDRNGWFETTSLSEDDLKRSAMYAQNAKRAQAQASFADYGEYLDSLEMRGTIQPFEPLYMSRIAQLTNKSNQFNLTTKRYTLSEVEAAANDAARITLYGKLEDRFGDNGVVSIVIGRTEGDSLHVELWLMSCRVLKRDMEFAMMDELVQKCRERGIATIYGYYYPTRKNGMVKDFYALQGFEKISEDKDGNTVWRFEIREDYSAKNTHIAVNDIPTGKAV